MSKPLFKNVCDEQIFAQIYRQWSTDLHNYVYYKYGRQVIPEDKVQEAFIKLWNHCKDTTPDKAKSFLFTVISNLCLNDIKHQKVVLAFQKNKPNQETNITPEHVLEEKEYGAKFERALANLTEGQRVAFMLNRVEGKRHQEIAELLGISKKAVEKRIYTALDRLKKEIGEF